MDGKPLKTRTPYASVKPLRMRSPAGRPTKETVSPPTESMHSGDPELHNFESGEDPLQVTCTVLQDSCASSPESGHSEDPKMLSSGSEEDALEDSDVVITGVQQGKACAALLNRRVEDFGPMVLSQHTCLDYKVIDHAQALMKVQHPYIGGLHATTSLALLSTVPTPAQGFVQILNVSANHWVTVSNVGCKVGTVNVFDSLGQQQTEDFIAQVTCLLAFPGRVSSCSGLMSKSRQVAQIVDCLLFRTVSLSAEVRIPPCSSTIRQLCGLISSLLFRLGF
ncbi:hypothetical protein ANANG_G00123520 [Anguilla anguilla]|uniref:Uncharacterized protein n=1 Tax=Anguilla anguilla TaxID=7936 RepID=A0A9D3MDW8_ANGAN|nr:hypothetical protein ANANG_G00123520 [Anguilla anguilla]